MQGEVVKTEIEREKQREEKLEKVKQLRGIK